MVADPNRQAFPYDRRGKNVTPLSEDTGLFKTALRDAMVELIPQTRRNDRDDLIVRGFVDRKTEIEFWFAGRRAKETGPLEQKLKALMTEARRNAAKKGAAEPDVGNVRLPIRVLGSWRRLWFRDESGWETGSYHFVVACWMLADASGQAVTFGERPVNTQIASPN